MLPYIETPPFKNTRLGKATYMLLLIAVLAGASFLVLRHIDDSIRSSSAPAANSPQFITPPVTPEVQQLYPSEYTPSEVTETGRGSYACRVEAATITIATGQLVDFNGTIIEINRDNGVTPPTMVALTFNDWSLSGDISLIVNTSLDGQRVVHVGQVSLNETDILQLNYADFTSGTIDGITLCVKFPTPPTPPTTPPLSSPMPSKSPQDMPPSFPPANQPPTIVPSVP